MGAPLHSLIVIKGRPRCRVEERLILVQEQEHDDMRQAERDVVVVQNGRSHVLCGQHTLYEALWIQYPGQRTGTKEEGP